MATQGERRALMFLAAVALLGAGTRAWRARQVERDSSDLEQQISAVDSATIQRSSRSRSRQQRARKAPAVQSSDAPARVPSQPVDLDRASADEIEGLPGIGPALAKRIVADRDANGPFGCLAALDSVKGIGPAMLGRLDSLATFSGPGRPACVRHDARGASPARWREGSGR